MSIQGIYNPLVRSGPLINGLANDSLCGEVLEKDWGCVNFYTYGFNGMEGDDELKGEGNSYTTHFRQYDPRVARWLSIDPIVHHNWSPYNSFDCNPVLFSDPRGGNAGIYKSAQTGEVLGDDGVDDGLVHTIDENQFFENPGMLTPQGYKQTLMSQSSVVTDYSNEHATPVAQPEGGTGNGEQNYTSPLPDPELTKNTKSNGWFTESSLKLSAGASEKTEARFLGSKFGAKVDAPSLTLFEMTKGYNFSTGEYETGFSGGDDDGIDFQVVDYYSPFILNPGEYKVNTGLSGGAGLGGGANATFNVRNMGQGVLDVSTEYTVTSNLKYFSIDYHKNKDGNPGYGEIYIDVGGAIGSFITLESQWKIGYRFDW